MTLPLTFSETVGISIRLDMINVAGATRLGYNLRKRYADALYGGSALAVGGTGSISMAGAGSSIGSAIDTQSRRAETHNIHQYVAAPATVETTMTYPYNQNLSNIPTGPASFINSYAQYTATASLGQFRQETDIDRIYNNVVSLCVNEMINGDEIGTYRIATALPTDGVWKFKHRFFGDSIFPEMAISQEFNLYIKTDVANPPLSNVDIPLILKVEPAGSFRQMPSTELEDVLYAVLVNSLNRNTLRYTVSTTEPTVNRGEFTDTRRIPLASVQTPVGPDDYQTTTELGTAVTTTTYYLGLS